LFHLPMPRLSVDIDLTYLPIEERDISLVSARAALERIVQSMMAISPQLRARTDPGMRDGLRAWVSDTGVQIKIELSPVFRGALAAPVDMEVHETVQETFGYAAMPVLQRPDLYGGKICAALDRQHPRDLFDVRMLLDGVGLSREIFEAFLVYLITSSRPIAEMLRPNLKDISEPFERHFLGMTKDPIAFETLLNARSALLSNIRNLMTESDKKFLLSVKRGEPEWSLLPFTNIEQLPAVRRKLENIRRMSKAAHVVAISQLEQVLSEL